MLKTLIVFLLLVPVPAAVCGAGISFSPAGLQSEGPCLFAEQLQESASIRNQYTMKLIAALGRTASTSNSFDEMDGKITPALYLEGESSHDEPTVNFWGLETRQATRTIGIDKFSFYCFGCHDGAAAMQITAVVKNNPPYESHLPVSDRRMIGMDHPIGMDYNRYVAASKDYRPLTSFSNKMVFIDGKVGCLTCHDPLIHEKGHLVMSDRDSALCLTCHNR